MENCFKKREPSCSLNFIMITGGSRSGKSTFAESIAKGYEYNKKGDVLYIATCIPFDEEMKTRVRKHRMQRPSHWHTLEAYKDFDVHLKKDENKKTIILVDCITLMISNIMFEENSDWENAGENQMNYVENKIMNEIDKLLDAVKENNATLIAVTNEVGMGIIPANKLSRIFGDIAGRVNQKLSKVASEVYFCVSGIPVKIKG
ncbi:MAG TPA: bifunctional adenosylcobinamide kinase/adenosylcobinamide-phosphate guanylyltransferase [Acetivibrio saccincola]|uniref:bifunctional adenosylcobinamide kinase/adenosylcobinamide-phosphate guanylyltransferase n=1 Tax=Acetivibrio saccincola TaxID=1677857 RepID=UPI002BD89A99|nr:bifunctional adenosylcobinamide kinase/adenosylcobinamide-phosphate guanylyltransferase [Acetivibrio saccincola]HOA96988.1 bifunctional adenosylcobinamide kinase/adenosylcobinamide-phosphate guanylyltransferase [Acetivibrio saccincola]HQD27911.1 bifunctional adenosylcobinamide kinase/adenosylcobinamide-phosphate guanylyltransferase [Acetivibrio saccincola]